MIIYSLKVYFDDNVVIPRRPSKGYSEANKWVEPGGESSAEQFMIIGTVRTEPRLTDQCEAFIYRP